MASTVSHPMANAEKLKKAKTTSGAAATAADEQHIGDYQIRPTENFDAVKIKEIIIDVFQQVLDGKEYSKADAAKWCQQIVNEINGRIVALKMPRYAHVVQITMMEQTGAGSRSITRCLWDAGCDHTVSETYKTKTMVCIVSVYGVYRY